MTFGFGIVLEPQGPLVFLYNTYILECSLEYMTLWRSGYRAALLRQFLRGESLIILREIRNGVLTMKQSAGSNPAGVGLLFGLFHPPLFFSFSGCNLFSAMKAQMDVLLYH